MYVIRGLSEILVTCYLAGLQKNVKPSSPVASRKTFELGGREVSQQKFTDRLLDFPEIPTNDERLRTS